MARESLGILVLNPVLPHASLQKSPDSQKNLLDLIFCVKSAQFCFRWNDLVISFIAKTFAPFPRLLKYNYIMLNPGKSHTNNHQAVFKSWKRHHSRSILDQST